MSELQKKVLQAQKNFKKPKNNDSTILSYINNYLRDYSLYMCVSILPNNDLYIKIVDEEENGICSYLDINDKSVEEIEKMRIYLMYFMMGTGLEDLQEVTQQIETEKGTVNHQEYHELFMALSSCQELMQPILNHYKVDHLSLIKRSDFKDCLARINLLKLTRR